MQVFQERLVLPCGGVILDSLLVRGLQPLKGLVKISGSKNAALPIMAASLMCSEEVIFAVHSVATTGAVCLGRSFYNSNLQHIALGMWGDLVNKLPNT
jgi:hypothetical protein